MWKQRTYEEKFSAISTLQDLRKQLRIESRKNRATVARKSKKEKMVFKSKELKELFESFPEELRKKLF